MCRHKTYSTNTLQSNSYKDYTSSAQSLIFNVFFFFPQGSGEQAWTFKEMEKGSISCPALERACVLRAGTDTSGAWTLSPSGAKKVAGQQRALQNYRPCIQTLYSPCNLF